MRWIKRKRPDRPAIIEQLTSGRLVIRRQRRASMMIRPIPGGYEVFIPHWLDPESGRVTNFIRDGIKKLGCVPPPVPPIQTSRSVILDMLHQWADQLRVNPRRVQFREMSRKWDSCSSAGAITLNTRLTWLPPHLAEYIVCHELIHLLEFSHGKPFKDLLDRHMPDWRERERELDGWRPAP